MESDIESIQSNPLKSVIRMSLPIICLLILQTFYALGDTFWVACLGGSEVIALGYIVNVTYVSNKIGSGTGDAVRVIISNDIGAKNFKRVNNVAVHGLLIIILLSIIVPLIAIPSIGYVCEIVSISAYSDLIFAYLLMPFGFIIFQLTTNYFAEIMGGEGDTIRPSIIFIIGNMLNLILDPIFMFHFRMGMFGAGLASAVSYMVSFLLFIYIFYYRDDTFVKIRFSDFEFDLSIIKEIIKLAIPIVLEGAIISIIGVIINVALHLFALDFVIIAYIIMIKIQDTAFSPIYGISRALGIVIGHLNGAKRFKNMQQLIIKTTIISLICIAFISIIIIKFNLDMAGLFTDDFLVLEEVETVAIFIVITLVNYTFITIVTEVLIGLKKSGQSLFFIVLNVILILISIFIFDVVLNLSDVGVFSAVVIADAIESLVMIYVLIRMNNKRILEEMAAVDV